MFRMIAGVIVQTVVFALLIFVPAQIFGASLGWWRGVVALAILAVVSAAGALWFHQADPDLARERASAPRAQSRADGLAMLVIAAAVVTWFGIVSWDVHRLRLPTLHTVPSLALGLAIFLAGVAAIVWTFRVNSYAVTIVKVQEDRGQSVIDNGPYALVRHPMYMGALAFFAGLGLILGSAASALLALPLFALAFTPRMIVEEAALRRDLPGYADGAVSLTLTCLHLGRWKPLWSRGLRASALV